MAVAISSGSPWESPSRRNARHPRGNENAGGYRQPSDIIRAIDHALRRSAPCPADRAVKLVIHRCEGFVTIAYSSDRAENAQQILVHLEPDRMIAIDLSHAHPLYSAILRFSSAAMSLRG